VKPALLLALPPLLALPLLWATRPAAAPTSAGPPRVCAGSHLDRPVRIPASRFVMGSSRYYPEEGPPTETEVPRLRHRRTRGDQSPVRHLRRRHRLSH
jgi:hypothetical protein